MRTLLRLLSGICIISVFSILIFFNKNETIMNIVLPLCLVGIVSLMILKEESI